MPLIMGKTLEQKKFQIFTTLFPSSWITWIWNCSISLKKKKETKKQQSIKLHEKHEHFFSPNIWEFFFLIKAKQIKQLAEKNSIITDGNLARKAQNKIHLFPPTLCSLFQVQHLLCSLKSTIHEAFNSSAPLAFLNNCFSLLYRPSYVRLIRAHLADFISNFQIPNTSLHENIR